MSTDRTLHRPLEFVDRAVLVLGTTPLILGLYTFGIALPGVAAAFHAVPGVATLAPLVGGITGLAFGAGSPLAGRLVERHGYRQIYAWSALLFAVAGATPLILDDLYLILVTRVLVGLAIAGTLVAVLSGIGALPDRERSRMLGAQAFAGSLIGIVGYFVVGKAAAFGWRAPFALHLVGLVMLPFILRLPSLAQQSPHSGASDPMSRAFLGGISPWFVLLALVIGMASAMPTLFGPFYLQGIGVTDPAKYAIPLMAMAFVAIPAAILFPRIYTAVGIDGCFAIGLLFSGVGLVGASFTGSVLELALAFGVAGAGFVIFSPTMNSAAASAAQESPGRALGMANGAFYGAQAMLPFVADAVRSIAGVAGVFFGFGVAALLLGIGFVVVGRRHRLQPAQV